MSSRKVSAPAGAFTVGSPPLSRSLRYMSGMCGRVIQKSRPDRLSLSIVDDLGSGSAGDTRWANVPPRYNGAPSQELWVIRRNPADGERALDLLRWGLIPHG